MILGVDFSGAKADNATWVTQAVLEGNGLRLVSSKPVRRAELSELLSSLPSESVAALDFPYSVPQQFAECWVPGSSEMPDLWAEAATMDFAKFLRLRDEFCSKHGEPMRRGDLYFPECYSCLHKFNPNMVPMTFRGMQMLHRLWGDGCRVPPLRDCGRSGPLLLESMPGAVINALGLPHKGYKNGRLAGVLRNQILDGLENRSGVYFSNLPDLRDQYLESHDCLDSLVAAVTAALWARDPSLFRCPGNDGGAAPTPRSTRRASPQALEMSELDAARLEGWIYAPKK